MKKWIVGILGFIVGFAVCFYLCATRGIVEQVEVVKEVPVEVEVIKEVPVEVEVIKEIPVEVEVIKEVEVRQKPSEPNVYKAGTYKVGVDIPSGKYICESSDYTTWNIMYVYRGSNPNFDNYDEFSIESYNNRGIFRVESGEYVKVTGGIFYLAD